jgi:FAD/FMN-containing dehydrogenase
VISEGFFDQLAGIVGEGHVLRDPDLLASYVGDWTGRFSGSTPAVVRPGSVDEVAEVVGLCAAERVPLVPQGGNTGLVGGSVPLGGEIVVSVLRLDHLGSVEEEAGQITAGAGVTVGAVQRAAKAYGWAYGVDLASRDSATVGGTIATNAGGLHVLRYGATRAQLLGVEAVLGTGAVISHLGGLRKDNTGYDLAGLLCGSEGTLGIVTAATLRLVPQANERVVALLAFETSDSAIAAGLALPRLVPSLSAAELCLGSGIQLVCDALGLPPPFPQPHEAYVLVEAAATYDPAPELETAVSSLAGVADVAVAPDDLRGAALWRYREAHTEVINTLGAPHKLDVALPARGLARFVGEVSSTVAHVDRGAATWLFGHVGDGAVHVNVTGVAPDDDRVDVAVLELVTSLGGSISAEHGIGSAKRQWLARTRSQAEIEAFRALKRAWDPAGICNPGVLLP